MLENTSRRTVAKGAAWAIPALHLTNTAPAIAASGGTTFTGTNDTVQSFYSEVTVVPRSCTTSKLNAGGFIDTQGCTPAGGPVSNGAKNGNCLLNPNSSIGTWVETTNATSGTAAIGNMTQTYTFNTPIAIDSCPTGYNNVPAADLPLGATVTTWTECTTLNGWTYSLSADGKTLTMRYAGTAPLQTSTAANGSGTYMPGYFINFHYVSICPTRSNTIQRSSSWTFYDKTNPNGVAQTKNTAARPVL